MQYLMLNVVEEKNPGNGQMDRIFMILKTKLTPWVHLSLPLGYIHVHDHNSQTSLLIYISRHQVSVHRSIGPLFVKCYHIGICENICPLP